MGDKSKIEWTEETWNPIRGCSRVSEGCRNCYAERVAARFSGPGQPYEGLAKMTAAGPRWTGKVRLVEEHLNDPLRWKRPRRIFVNSMSDLFHESLPDRDILEIFRIMKRANWHIYQMLTKRAERMRDFVRRLGQEDGVLFLDHLMGGMSPHLDHVWLGVSVEDQTTANERIPLLLETPAAVRWVSYEPALGPVGFRVSWLSVLMEDGPERMEGIDWIVCGGESGPGARPMHPDWARSARDQCVAANVPFFFKQRGEWMEVPAIQRAGDMALMAIEDEHSVRMRPCVVRRVGKKTAGRLLDGREWNEYPETPAPKQE